MNDWNIHGISIEKMNPIGGIIIDDWWLILKKEHLDMFEWLFWKHPLMIDHLKMICRSYDNHWYEYNHFKTTVLKKKM